MGFNTVGAYARAHEEGRIYTTHFRKNPPHTTVAGNWYDLSIASGYPRPNYYAASPLVAATLDGNAGIYHGTDKSPYTKHLARWSLCSPTAGAVGGPYRLLDYLIYYPFIDGDAVGEIQSMDNTVTLPRYTDGVGVYAMGVCVAPTVGGGSFTVTYVDDQGTTVVSPTVTMSVAALNIATLINSAVAEAGVGACFLPLGSRGIRSITDVTMISASGGLFTIVLVKPLAINTLREASTVREAEFFTNHPGPPRVYDGAYLNMIVQPTATLAGGVITGHMDFHWSN